MRLGAHSIESPERRGRWDRTVFVCALVLACILAGLTTPVRSEPLSEKDRFAKVGGPVSENIDIAKIRALLKSAKGVSLVDKIELRQHLIAFTEEFYKFHKGTSERTLAQLRAQFEKLHRQIVALLSPENPQVSTYIEQARVALWSAYSDREAFTSTVGREVVKDVEGEGAGLVGQRYEAPTTPGSSGSFFPTPKKAPKEVHGERGVKP
jgi:hypothetical protein